MPSNIRMTPPAISALDCKPEPKTLPILTPAAERTKVVQPISRIAGRICTSKKAKVTPTASASMLVAIFVAERLADHIRADQRKQHKGYPVVDALDQALKLPAQQPAEQRHQRLKAAEIQAGCCAVARTELFDRQSLAHRDRERVHGKAHGDQE